MQIHSQKNQNSFSFDNNILRDNLKNIKTEKIWEQFGNKLPSSKQVGGVNMQNKLVIFGTLLGIGLILYTVTKA